MQRKEERKAANYLNSWAIQKPTRLQSTYTSPFIIFSMSVSRPPTHSAPRRHVGPLHGRNADTGNSADRMLRALQYAKVEGSSSARAWA